MVLAFRNALIAVAVPVCAVLLAAAAQGVVQYAAPGLAARIIGATDVSTYVGDAAIATVFLCAGVWVPDWLRSRVPLLWLLLPIAAAYFAVARMESSPFSCSPLVHDGCWLVLSPFIIGTAAVFTGWLLRSVSRARDVV